MKAKKKKSDRAAIAIREHKKNIRNGLTFVPSSKKIIGGRKR